MLATLHTLQALKYAWPKLAATRDGWIAFFASFGYPLTGSADEPLSGRLYDALCPNGAADRVTFANGLVHGRGQIPGVYVGAGQMGQIDDVLGQNLAPGVEANASFAETITIDVIAATYWQCEIIAYGVIGLLLQSKYWLVVDEALGPAYRTADFAGMTPIGAYTNLEIQKGGMFRTTIRWKFERNVVFPPLLGTPATPAYLSIHDIDSYDQWGNPGRVRPDSEDT